MDREQEELQFLGILGIYREAFGIIFPWRKIFSQITLALILPLTFIFLAHIEISELITSKIIDNEVALDETQIGSPKYKRLVDLLSSENITIWIVKVIYFLFLIILSLLSTSAIIYTIACIYTAKELTFKKVMSVVPKVWKRLMVTLLCTFIIAFLYDLVVMLFLTLYDIFFMEYIINDIVIVAIGVLYLMGLVYITVHWHLATVISVLEDAYGIQAFLKSRELIKGKLGVAIFILLKLNLSFYLIQDAFQWFVVYGEPFGVRNRIAFGIICFLLLLMLFLFGFVVQTVIYFVCKSYHHENIDKSSLADHLEVYLGEYVPLKCEGVQLEEYHV